MIDDIACVTVIALNHGDAVPISAGNDLVSFVSLCTTTAALVIRVPFVTQTPTRWLVPAATSRLFASRAASSLAVMGFHVSSLPSSGGRKSQEFM